jgi:hypothetical protein
MVMVVVKRVAVQQYCDITDEDHRLQSQPVEVDRHPDFFMAYVSGCSSKCSFTTITTQTLAGKYREVLLLSIIDLLDFTVLDTRGTNAATTSSSNRSNSSINVLIFSYHHLGYLGVSDRVWSPAY